MSKPKPILIHIPEPCTQGWDTMTPTTNGRFCDHCSKEVIDFSTWSDPALFAYFSKNTGHVCGRYLATQVDRPINIPYQPHSHLYRIAIALGLTLLATQVPTTSAHSRPPLVSRSIFGATDETTGGDSTGIFKGRVLDEKKQPLASAGVMLYQNGIMQGGAATDYDGWFSIKKLNPGKYDVLVLYSGYDSLTTQVAIIENDTSFANFQMKIHYTKELTNGYVVGRDGGRSRFNLPNKIKDTVEVPKSSRKRIR
jgi:hypothetical protein